MPGGGHVFFPTIHVPLRPPPSFLLRLLQKPSLKFPPPKAISICCLLHIHLLCFRKGQEWSPSHIPVQLSQPHAYAYLCCASRPDPLEWSTETLRDVWGGSVSLHGAEQME